jgi:hypothetical protein
VPEDDDMYTPRHQSAPRPRGVPQARPVDPSVAWFNTPVAVSPWAFGSRDRDTFAVRVLYSPVPELRDDVAAIDKAHAHLFEAAKKVDSAAAREFRRADEHPIFAKRGWCVPIPEKLTGGPGFWMRDVCLPNDLIPPKFGSKDYHWDTDFEVLIVRVTPEGLAVPDPEMPDDRRGRLIKRIKFILDHQDGALVLARLVHANNLLFQDGPQPALNVGVVFSFDRDADRRLLLSAARLVAGLKSEEPDDPELEPLAQFVMEADDDAVRYSRIAIPTKCTHGIPVYHGNLVVPRFCLPFRRLDRSDFESALRCVAGRGPKGWLDMVPDDYWDRARDR